jgi:hypothetical protein
MIVRGMAAGAMFLVLGQGAVAGEKPNLVHRVSCTVVRYYVAKYSASAAETWARSRGATDAEIENARHCLTGASVQAVAAK